MMDIVKAVVTHLRDETGVRVATERPANSPTPLITCVRTGGGGDMFTERARIIVHSWADSDEQAAKLGMQVADAMFELPYVEDNIAHVSQDSFYANPYTDGTRRWSGAYVIMTNR